MGNLLYSTRKSNSNESEENFHHQRKTIAEAKTKTKTETNYNNCPDELPLTSTKKSSARQVGSRSRISFL